MCEKSTNVREGSCIVVIMVAKGGEGGVTDAPLKNTRVTTLRSKENSLTFTEPKIMPQGRTVATEQIRKGKCCIFQAKHHQLWSRFTGSFTRELLRQHNELKMNV